MLIKYTDGEVRGINLRDLENIDFFLVKDGTCKVYVNSKHYTHHVFSKTLEDDSNVSEEHFDELVNELITNAIST